MTLNYVHNNTTGINDIMKWWEIILIVAGCIAVVVMLMYPMFVVSGRISEEGKAKVKEKESKDENR